MITSLLSQNKTLKLASRHVLNLLSTNFSRIWTIIFTLKQLQIHLFLDRNRENFRRFKFNRGGVTSDRYYHQHLLLRCHQHDYILSLVQTHCLLPCSDFSWQSSSICRRRRIERLPGRKRILPRRLRHRNLGRVRLRLLGNGEAYHL